MRRRFRYYIANKTRANKLRISDGIVTALEADGIIYRSSSIGALVTGFAFNISDVAWDYLNKHPELLAGETDDWRTDKVDWLDTF